MEIKYETVLIESPKMKAMKNPTVQWFLFGDRDYLNKKVLQVIEKFNKEAEERAKNVFLFGTSNPEIFD